MTDEEKIKGTEDVKQYYVLGLVVLVAVVIAGYLIRNKSVSPAPAATQEQAAPAQVKGQITKLSCDTQYYNPRIGYKEYYLSVEGGDVSKASTVDCTLTVSSKEKELASVKGTSPLTDNPQRGGGTFRCTTKAIELPPGVPTVVSVALKDDLGATATCSAPFVFPAP